ncbi:uncharacterized protein LOC122966231 [Thunnus albacares]|uniref:uncharacterized protein LOC122966231 n=1 Tax=Thunnus albacares TaxID=8236 RepID=UPI001CF6B27C|nr:uncharacterized protein LOC122966231 [Thunnus albacares]XP_044186213.1 uncharacterized protein LOC122966231 [Thunnus albacares]
MGIWQSKQEYSTDVSINQTIMKFCSLDSSDMLKQHYEKRRMEASDCAPDWIKNLTEKLGDFTSAPEMAGLGALAVAVFIDMKFSSPQEESTKDALRCVFAEQKASEVRDLIDHCLETCWTYIDNAGKLRSELERIDGQLSAALTKLKNSMLDDGHWTNNALKAWVNGAAFRIQMMIHQVRLGGTDTYVKRLLSAYQDNLESLFTEHKEMIRKKCKLDMVMRYDEDLDPNGPEYMFFGENSNFFDYGHDLDFDDCFNRYYYHIYGKQWRDNENHFSYVTENLQRLVSLRGSINF